MTLCLYSTDGWRWSAFKWTENGLQTLAKKWCYFRKKERVLKNVPCLPIAIAFYWTIEIMKECPVAVSILRIG